MNFTAGYMVTNDGRVFSEWSNWRGYGIRELQQTENSHGYPSVRIYISGKRKRICVHRLVTLHYLPKRPSERHEIRHLDGNKKNNHFSNLKWGTKSDNAIDRQRHLFRGRHNAAKLNVQDIHLIRELFNKKEKQNKIALLFGVTPQAINSIVKQKSWRNI